MRITCPNCNAQYEVGDDMIPSEGRDVQCSNCGTTWFQDGRPRAASAVQERAVRRPGRRATDLPVEDDEVDDDDDIPEPVRARARRVEPDQQTLDILREERDLAERRHDDEGTSEGSRDTASDDDRDGDVPDVVGSQDAMIEGAPGNDTPDKNAPDDNATDDGGDADETPSDDQDETSDPRQKAAAERARMAAAATLARARGSARGGRGTRTVTPAEEPDIDVSDVIAETLRDAAAPSGDDGVDDNGDPFDGTDTTNDAPVSARAARRELLPDIEEINSSLRPDERAAEAEAAADAEAEAPRMAKRMSGFRLGFLTVCGVILILVGIYVFADHIGEAVPQASTVLTKYVAWVDVQRMTIAAAAEKLTESISPDR
ncbi:zinc-ribbon domain-containing protein [Jannaschia donghaensis]|uniref:Family finger-like domain protein n=1 Tax=Jannaschia donghaensis TaxID=420998 RepID=A0A0M6YH68_9RHOB|nr:zinc-ribbon domain-containing protein [Jannaschia donghaensis]CTQ48597.1 family finger-like domain protein [Jannaschia donghaensis]